jgi:hypothetical protein
MDIKVAETTAKDYEHIIRRIDGMIGGLRDLRKIVETMYNRSLRITNWEDALMADIIDPKESGIARRAANVLIAADCYDMRIMQFLHTISHRHIKGYRNAGNSTIRFIQNKIRYHTGYDWSTKTDKDLDPVLVALHKTNSIIG